MTLCLTHPILTLIGHLLQHCVCYVIPYLSLAPSSSLGCKTIKLKSALWVRYYSNAHLGVHCQNTLSKYIFSVSIIYHQDAHLVFRLCVTEICI